MSWFSRLLNKKPSTAGVLNLGISKPRPTVPAIAPSPVPAASNQSANAQPTGSPVNSESRAATGKQHPDEPVPAKPTSYKPVDWSHSGIRCPLCGWSPRKQDIWLCSCGQTWNTFETRGKCAACHHQWISTHCLWCSKLSAHVDWYEDSPLRYKPPAQGDPAMSFPGFNYCLLCEQLRLEVNGKPFLIGFLGISPNVLVAITDMNRPIFLTAMAGFSAVPEGDASYEYVAIVSRPDGAGIFQTPLTKFKVSPTFGSFISFGFPIPPVIASGAYSIRILVNREVKLDASFSLQPAGAKPSNPAVGTSHVM